MATAVIRTGGRQFLVTEGETVRVEKLPGNPGDEVVFGDVLMLGGEQPTFGRPTLNGATVKGRILAQERGPKLVVFKFRRRKKYRSKAGHRQSYTAVRIVSITGR
jgi:large subunit ribosomal protein L21